MNYLGYLELICKFCSKNVVKKSLLIESILEFVSAGVMKISLIRINFWQPSKSFDNLRNYMPYTGFY